MWLRSMHATVLLAKELLTDPIVNGVVLGGGARWAERVGWTDYSGSENWLPIKLIDLFFCLLFCFV